MLDAFAKEGKDPRVLRAAAEFQDLKSALHNEASAKKACDKLAEIFTQHNLIVRDLSVQASVNSAGPGFEIVCISALKGWI